MIDLAHCTITLYLARLIFGKRATIKISQESSLGKIIFTTLKLIEIHIILARGFTHASFTLAPFAFFPIIIRF